MVRSWNAYYGNGVDGRKRTAQITQGGEQGEALVLSANHYALLVRQVLRLLCGHKATLKAVAANGDPESIGQAMTGDALLDWYDKQALLAEKDIEAVLCGLLLGSGWRVYGWATELGEEIGVDDDTGRVVKTGDVVTRSLTPWDVAFDADEDDEKRRWFCYRYKANRFELAAKYQQAKHELLRSSDEDFINQSSTVEGLIDARKKRYSTETDSDSVTVWEFRHLRTPALPNGRLVRFVNAKCVLYDSANAKMGDGQQTGDAGYPYPNLLAYEFCPERVVGQPDGHSSHWDTLSLQEAMDLSFVAATTNVNLGGMVRLWAPPGGVPNAHTLANGLTILESPVKPEILDMMALPPELLRFGELLKEMMTALVGLNDVALGETTSGMPAQLAALLEAKALQYQQTGQSAYVRLLEKSRTGLLELLQRFADSERSAELVGRNGGWALAEWSKKDISALKRVSVELVNPIMKSFAGRMQVADSLLAKGAINVNQYMSLYTTGSLTAQLEPAKTRESRIAKEKELLMRGVGLPPVDMQASLRAGTPVFTAGSPDSIRPLITDRHAEEIQEYLSVLDSPEARSNPKVTQAVLDLVQEKLRLWGSMPPDLLVATNQQPLPSAQAAAAQAQQQMAAPQGAPAPTLGAGPEIQQPSPPPNPITGEQEGPPLPQ